MGGGRPMLMPISTLAIVGTGTTITIDNAKSNVPKNNFFIFLPPMAQGYKALRP
jgi:hypothetical protein